MSDKPLVHVTFGASAAHSLKKILQRLGRDEEVVFLADDLSYGPIATANVHERMQWIADELDTDPKDEQRITEFWTRVSQPHAELVAWMSSRYVTEYCGLLALVSLAQTVAISVVDVAGVEFKRQDGSPSADTSLAFAYVNEEQFIDRKLYDGATRISDIERKRYEAEWRRLQQENGALRVLGDSGVESVPIDHFDATILSFVTNEWRPCAHVIGDTLYELGNWPYRQCSSDILFFERLLRLVEDGVVEGKKQQELWSMRESWVRRNPA